jgi:hypothetical protein
MSVYAWRESTQLAAKEKSLANTIVCLYQRNRSPLGGLSSATPELEKSNTIVPAPISRVSSLPVDSLKKDTEGV